MTTTKKYLNAFLLDAIEKGFTVTKEKGGSYRLTKKKAKYYLTKYAHKHDMAEIWSVGEVDTFGIHGRYIHLPRPMASAKIANLIYWPTASP